MTLNFNYKGLIGEVQTNPISNTILGRLKDLLTGIILGSGTNIIGKVGIDQTTPGVTNGVSVVGSLANVTHTAVNATVVTGEVLAANTNRKYALIINDSDATVYIKIGAAAVLNQGIRLNAYGSSYELSHSNGNLNTGAINAIHGGAGNKALLVTEGV